MNPIFETCQPCSKVGTDNLTEGTFAARLRDVIDGTADGVYQGPRWRGHPHSWMPWNRSLRTGLDQGAVAAVVDLQGTRSSPSFDTLWPDEKALLGAHW